MELHRIRQWGLCLALLLGSARSLPSQPSFRLATYNLEAYLLSPTAGRPAKSPASRAKVQESLKAAQADVLALQEVGSISALRQLQVDLQRLGLNYPHWDHVTGFDTNIHLAILSRFPIVARRPHTNESFLLYGRRYHVSRGFAEVDIQVTPHYRFTLLNAHLKSQRPVHYADQAELREEEARLLRQIISRRLARNPELNLVLLGDLNDTKDSPTLRLLLGRGRSALVDLRPAERNGDGLDTPDPVKEPRTITWTHYYAQEDSYSRIDYILLSRGMARELQGSRIVTIPNWGVGSDHRPLAATFHAQDR
jgi:endonuclease/exonuclease/phosphatase family metal-dependent hydrolase